MTLSGKIVAIVNPDVPIVRVDFGEGVVRAVPSLLPDVRVGEYVTVYRGLVVEKTTEADRFDMVRLLSETAETP